MECGATYDVLWKSSLQLGGGGTNAAFVPPPQGGWAWRPARVVEFFGASVVVEFIDLQGGTAIVERGKMDENIMPLDSMAPAHIRHHEYEVGEDLDVLDIFVAKNSGEIKRKWRRGQVVGITQYFVRVHFVGWSSVYDAWIHVLQEMHRLAGFGTHTRRIKPAKIWDSVPYLTLSAEDEVTNAEEENEVQWMEPTTEVGPENEKGFDELMEAESDQILEDASAWSGNEEVWTERKGHLAPLIVEKTNIRSAMTRVKEISLMLFLFSVLAGLTFIFSPNESLGVYSLIYEIFKWDSVFSLLHRMYSGVDEEKSFFDRQFSSLLSTKMEIVFSDLSSATTAFLNAKNEIWRMVFFFGSALTDSMSVVWLFLVLLINNFPILCFLFLYFMGRNSKAIFSKARDAIKVVRFRVECTLCSAEGSTEFHHQKSGAKCGSGHFFCRKHFIDMIYAKADGVIRCPECDHTYIFSEKTILEGAGVDALLMVLKNREERNQVLIEGALIAGEKKGRESAFNEAELMSLRQIRIAKVRLEIENMALQQCPRCGVAFEHVEGCAAMICDNCGCGFCGFCLADCGPNAHDHVQNCPYKPAFGDATTVWGSPEETQNGLARKIRQNLQDYWRNLRADLKRDVYRDPVISGWLERYGIRRDSFYQTQSS